MQDVLIGTGECVPEFPHPRTLHRSEELDLRTTNIRRRAAERDLTVAQLQSSDDKQLLAALKWVGTRLAEGKRKCASGSHDPVLLGNGD